MTSRQAAHELADAFAFPDYYGRNWVAFNDCFGDFVEQHDGERFAVVWENVHAAVISAPATAIEVGWALLDCVFSATPTLAPGARWVIDLDVFAIGTGDDFDRP